MIGDSLRIDSEISLSGAGFGVQYWRLWIKYDGDVSRYHQIISLDRESNGDWVLTKKYVVPGHSYWNKTKSVDITNIREWLIVFISANKEYIAGGRIIPPGALHINFGRELKE